MNFFSSGKGGKNRRRGKNENEETKRELEFKEAGQEYAQVGTKWICSGMSVLTRDAVGCLRITWGLYCPFGQLMFRWVEVLLGQRVPSVVEPYRGVHQYALPARTPFQRTASRQEGTKTVRFSTSS